MPAIPAAVDVLKQSVPQVARHRLVEVTSPKLGNTVPNIVLIQFKLGRAGPRGASDPIAAVCDGSLDVPERVSRKSGRSTMVALCYHILEFRGDVPGL